MRMSNNIVRSITMTNGFLVFKFHPQFHQLSFQTRGYYYESRQKVKFNPLSFCSFDSEVLRVLLPPPQALNKLKFLMRAYTRIQLLPSALPPPPIITELYNFLYSQINNINP